MLFDVFLCGGCLDIQALTVTFMCFLQYLKSFCAFCFQSTSFSDLAIIFFWKDYLDNVQMQVFRKVCSTDVIAYFLKKKLNIKNLKY